MSFKIFDNSFLEKFLKIVEFQIIDLKFPKRNKKNSLTFVNNSPLKEAFDE